MERGWVFHRLFCIENYISLNFTLILQSLRVERIRRGDLNPQVFTDDEMAALMEAVGDNLLNDVPAASPPEEDPPPIAARPEKTSRK